MFITISMELLRYFLSVSFIGHLILLLLLLLSWYQDTTDAYKVNAKPNLLPEAHSGSKLF